MRVRDIRPVWQAIHFSLRTVVRANHQLTGKDRRRIRDYLAKSPVRKLQIGAGSNLREGWLNTNWFPTLDGVALGEGPGDAALLDAASAFPLPDASFDYVYSEHVIEHLPEPAGANLIRETFRVLKPGGKFRVSTPDINFLVRLMGPELTDLERRYIEWAGFPTQGSTGPTALSVVNNFVRDWGHLFIYDEETLAASMRAAGFIDIKPFKILESDDPELAGLENADRMEDGFLQLETMTLQGTKPQR